MVLERTLIIILTLFSMHIYGDGIDLDQSDSFDFNKWTAFKKKLSQSTKGLIYTGDEGLTSLYSFLLQYENLTDIKEVLKQQGIFMHIRDKHLNTLLHYAVMNGNIDFIDKLMDIGLSPYTKNIDGNNPFLLAVILGNFEAVRHFIKKEDIWLSYNKKGNTALHLAIAHNQITEILEFLLVFVNKTPKKLNTPNKRGDTAVHFAMYGPSKRNQNSLEGMSEKDIENLNLKMTELILNYDVKLNIRNESQETPLTIAIRENQYEKIKALLKKGASTRHNKMFANNDVLFTAIVYNKNPEILRLILNSVGKDTDLLPYVRRSIIQGHRGFIKIFLEHGVQLHQINNILREFNKPIIPTSPLEHTLKPPSNDKPKNDCENSLRPK